MSPKRSKDRRLLAVTLREQGLTLAEVGQFFGVTPSRGRQLIEEGEMILRHQADRYQGSRQNSPLRSVASAFPVLARFSCGHPVDRVWEELRLHRCPRS